jgi:hypothetical protein
MKVVKSPARLQNYQMELPLVWWGGDEICIIQVTD